MSYASATEQMSRSVNDGTKKAIQRGEQILRENDANYMSPQDTLVLLQIAVALKQLR